MNKKTIIGYFDLKEPKVYTNTFSFAVWYENVEVQPGQYPIEVINLKVFNGDVEYLKGQIEGYINGGYITMPGTIVSDYFAGHYGGMPMDDYDTTQNAGKGGQHTSMAYLHEIAKSIVEDKDSPYHLNPEYEAREINFISTFDGKPVTTWGIFKK